MTYTCFQSQFAAQPSRDAKQGSESHAQARYTDIAFYLPTSARTAGFILYRQAIATKFYFAKSISAERIGSIS
jgi:hypothetical protein